MWILILVLLMSLIYYSKNLKESFAWECTWKPNKDYYKEDWLLGEEPVANALARDSIKK